MEAANQARTLVLVRHAKSSWEFDVDDHERPLSPRGRRDSTAIGAFLVNQQLRADLVLCSTATRTRQTWAGAVTGGAEAGEVLFAPQIYGAWVPELMRLVHEAPATVTTLLMLGHAPGIPDLVERICARTTSPAWAQLAAKYPTSAVAVVRVSGDWTELGHGRAELVSFTVPRG